MAHQLNGFELTFTGRTTWKAERRHRGALIDVVPVTWTIGWRRDSQLLQVWYRDKLEMLERSESRDPFVVAVALAKGYTQEPYEFSEFRSLLRVIPTGTIMSENSIDTRVIESVLAK